MNLQTLPLAAITRISPLNPRHDEDDVSQLAATIRAAGLQYPLLVMANPEAPGTYEVLDGGRRWRALKSFMSEVEEIPVEIHAGDEHSARRATLALSVTPRALHPVAEYEAFAKLLDVGFDVAAIARDFGLAERHVRQRLALGRLAPCVRDAWRKGQISRDSAEAFTVGALEAQEALFNSWAGTIYENRLQRPYEIRASLRGDALDDDSEIARFLLADRARLDAYCAAGGRVEEDLFSDAVGICDGPIAERVVSDLLLDEARAIAAAEGWGSAAVELEGMNAFAAPASHYNADLTEEEERRVEELGEAIGDCEGEERARLQKERDGIFAAAILRHYPVEDRSSLRVVAFLGWDGHPEFVRGVRLEAAEATCSDVVSFDDADIPEDMVEMIDDAPVAVEAKDEARDEPAAASFAEPGKATRSVIDAAVSRALREATARRVDLALMFAVAALGSQHGVIGLSALRPVQFIDNGENDLLRRIRPMPFQDALIECAAASTNDLTVAFARVVGQAFDVRNATMNGLFALIGAARARGANMVAAFGDALDRKGFFEALPKGQTLKIVGGLIGDGEAKRVKGLDRAKLADYVATLSRDKGHLPSPFAEWARLPELPQAADEAMAVDDETPLAQAMAAAIAADEGHAPARKKRGRPPGAAKRAASQTVDGE